MDFLLCLFGFSLSFRLSARLLPALFRLVIHAQPLAQYPWTWICLRMGCIVIFCHLQERTDGVKPSTLDLWTCSMSASPTPLGCEGRKQQHFHCPMVSTAFPRHNSRLLLSVLVPLDFDSWHVSNSAISGFTLEPLWLFVPLPIGPAPGVVLPLCLSWPPKK